MASKIKRARLAAEQKKSKTIIPVLLWSLAAALVGYLQNRYGQFSDIRGFYGMRFMDGLHHWPYDSYTPAGATTPLNPIEYPAITGLIVWLLTFFVPKSGNPIINYFAINAFLNALLFLGTTYFVRKMSDTKTTYLYIFAPAVVLALNLNWDLWAMLPMLAAIYYFDKKKYDISAALLGISIAVKFFPIILLLPIFVYLFRHKHAKLFLRYLVVTILSWLIPNLPVMFSSFEGWKYFYTFSFSRGLGDGSIYSIINKVGIDITFQNEPYYVLNIGVFSALIIYLFFYKKNIPLTVSAFLTIVAFTYFGKQYSMQYILWLTPLATIALYKANVLKDKMLIIVYSVWQITEMSFRYAYFQNLLTNVYSDRNDIEFTRITDSTYGYIGLTKYFLVATFMTLFINRVNRLENLKEDGL